MLPSRRRSTPTFRALVALLPLAFVACDAASLVVPGARISGSVDEAIGANLMQSVTVSPSALLDGNDVEVRSVLRNRGQVVVALESRICGLDFGGSLETVSFLLHCAGYSQATQLAPGDSIVTSDVLRVASPPGTYVLRVRHAVDPDHWASVPTVVRD